MQSEHVSQVISIGRKSSTKQHAKLEELIVPNLFELDLDNMIFKDVDAVFFCIGVYTGAVDKATFRKITTDLPVAFAKQVYEHSPNTKFCLLSGAGADRTEKSRAMFARDKGAAENQLAAIGFKAFHSFRPAYIYPVNARKEPNFMYEVSRQLYPLIKLFGKNASIESVQLAQAMFNVGMDESITKEVLENYEILEFAK